MQYSRVLGVDYGDVRIGLALSDLLQMTATPTEVFQNKGQEQSVDYLTKIIKDNEVSVVVFGLPINMDGTEGERAKITREFAGKLLEKTAVKIVFQDERLTSVEAEDMLIDAKMSWQERKKVIDKISAGLILEGYLNRKERL